MQEKNSIKSTNKTDSLLGFWFLHAIYLDEQRVIIILLVMLGRLVSTRCLSVKFIMGSV